MYKHLESSLFYTFLGQRRARRKKGRSEMRKQEVGRRKEEGHGEGKVVAVFNAFKNIQY